VWRITALVWLVRSRKHEWRYSKIVDELALVNNMEKLKKLAKFF
jgi:hypothetical protein